MGTYALNMVESTNVLVQIAHELQEPVVVTDAGDECLVAMTPAVFERFLFGTFLLEAADRPSLRL